MCGGFQKERPGRRILRAGLLSILLISGAPLVAQEQGGPLLPAPGAEQGAGDGADDSRIFFEVAFSYLLQGRDQLARRNFERALAAGGDYADLNRIALVRLLGREKRAPGTSRLPEVRALLGQVQQRDLIGTAWFAAMEALYDYGERDAALELALEMPRRFPDSDRADEALLLAARILMERQRRAAALDQLFYLLDRHGDSDQLDEAHFLMAKIYLDPGVYYSPVRARAALEPFVRPAGAQKELFTASLWRERALQLFARLN